MDDEDAITELIVGEFRSQPAWAAMERALLEKRDRMVALMVVEIPKKDTDVAVAYAAQQRRLGYIECLNMICKLPGDLQEQARKARLT